jgi:hypothetical protein
VFDGDTIDTIDTKLMEVSSLEVKRNVEEERRSIKRSKRKNAKKKVKDEGMILDKNHLDILDFIENRERSEAEGGDNESSDTDKDNPGLAGAGRTEGDSNH